MGYIVEQSDLTGVFEDYPIEIIQLLIKRVEEQGNDGEKALKIIRDKKIYADRNNGGLDWDDTPERYDFWSDILNTAKPLEERLRIFHEKYPKLTYPRVMEVSHYESYSEYYKRVVFMEKNGRYISWYGAESLEESEKVTSTSDWKYAREISPKVEEIELTLDEIAEKFNIPVNKLKIKK